MVTSSASEWSITARRLPWLCTSCEQVELLRREVAQPRHQRAGAGAGRASAVGELALDALVLVEQPEPVHQERLGGAVQLDHELLAVGRLELEVAVLPGDDPVEALLGTEVVISSITA